MGHSLGVDFNARRTRRIGDTCVAAVELHTTPFASMKKLLCAPQQRVSTDMLRGSSTKLF